MAVRKGTLDTGRIGTVTAVMPIHDRRKGWIRKATAVGYGYRRDGTAESPADAESFAAAILASADAARARELASRALPCAPIEVICRKAVALPGAYSEQPAVHVGCKHDNDGAGGIRGLYSKDDREAIARLAAAFDERRGIVRSPVAPEPVQVTRKARAPRKVATAPDAMTLCNGCELAPMVAPEHPGYAAGYCAECYAAAIEPEPVAAEPVTAPEPVQDAPSAEQAPEPIQVPLAPVAPVAAVLAAPSAERPTCPRCGQTFRLSGNGRAWHVANRPDCAGRSAAAA